MVEGTAMLDQPDAHPPAGSASTRSGRRLQRLVTSRVETGEDLVTWTRAWVSRDGQFNAIVAARSRDFVVLTTRRLMIWSTGFFTRLPRRRVLTERLNEVTVEPIGESGRRLRVRAFRRSALRIEVGSDEQSHTFVRELTDRTRAAKERAIPNPDAQAPDIP
jgi:hypothetical protein